MALESFSPKEKYINGLQRTVDTLNSSGIQFVVVGGIAVRAILGSEVEYKHPNGTSVDLDIISLSPLEEMLPHNPFFPPTNIESVDTTPAKYHPYQFLSGLRKEGSRYYLTYRAIEQEVPSDSFRIIERYYGGVIIPTLPAETVYYRYFIRGGVAKRKDLEKLERLEKFIKTHPAEQISEQSRQAHELFLQNMSQQYPCAVRGYKYWWDLDYLTGDRISGSLGAVSPLIRIFR